MILITVILKSSPQLLQFHFDSFKDADAILRKCNRWEEIAIIDIEDDYGSKAMVFSSEIGGIFLTDLSKELEAQEKCQMLKIQMDIRIQKKIQQDPAAMILKPKQGFAQ